VPGARVVVASNRGPVSFKAADDGTLTAHRGGGGLVSALRTVLASGEAVWVCAALSEPDRDAARSAPRGRLDEAGHDTAGAAVRMLALDPHTYDRAYNGIANGTLWFTSHHLYDAATQPVFDRAWRREWEAYVEVNTAFADALAEEAAPEASVVVQDYHLTLVPRLLRERRPDLRIGWFSHTPWAAPDVFRMLPDDVAADLLTGILGADHAGFLTHRWADAFVECAVRHLDASARHGSVRLGEHDCDVGVHALGIDGEELRSRAGQPDVASRRTALEAWAADRQVVLRIDRTELSKNIVRGLMAFRELLRTRPEWHERVVHLAFAYPSRHDLPEYREYTASVQRTARRDQPGVRASRLAARTPRGQRRLPALARRAVDRGRARRQPRPRRHEPRRQGGARPLPRRLRARPVARGRRGGRARGVVARRQPVRRLGHGGRDRGGPRHARGGTPRTLRGAGQGGDRAAAAGVARRAAHRARPRSRPVTAPVTMRAALHASPLDARRGIVRMHPDVLSLLGLRPWEPLELTAKRRTGALVALSEPDADRSLLFMDELVLANVGVRPGDQVLVSPALVAPAATVELGGLPRPVGEADVAALRMALLGKVVTAGDGVSLLPQDFARPHDGDLPLDKLVTQLAREWGQSWQSWVLTVVSASPGGLVRVGMQTAVAAGTVTTTTSSTPVAEQATLADLPALDPQVKVLREWLELGFHRADLLHRLGAKAEVGVLVSGPAGSGKGPLVQAVSREVGAKVFRIWAPALARSEPNDATASLKQTIAKASASAPAVVLIEDVEALAPRTDAGPLLSVLLENVAAAVRDPGVAVVCTTSRPEEVCPDLRRPGRLDHELTIPLPQRGQRQRILGTYSRGMPLAADVVFEEIAARTPGFVAADLKALCREASLRAAQRLSSESVLEAVMSVTQGDFVAALEVVRPSAVEQSSLEVADVSLDDVGDMAEVKRQLTEMVVWPLAYPETFSRLGVEPGRGVLLYGPPGCGKTHLVKALANAAQANFFAVRGAELLSKWVGESERGVRELFRRARGSAPALVFFDEVDALAPARGGDDNGPTDRVVAQLLTELDGIEELRDVFVVAATNRPELVDPALLRPGRLDRLVHVPPPDGAARGLILRAVTKRMPLAPDVDPDALGEACERYSAADLEALAREAAMEAMRESMAAPVVTAAHFAAARSVVGPSIDPAAARVAEEWAGRYR
jgi:transitional endoplasmic reticulum ATPase